MRLIKTWRCPAKCVVFELPALPSETQQHFILCGRFIAGSVLRGVFRRAKSHVCFRMHADFVFQKPLRCWASLLTELAKCFRNLYAVRPRVYANFASQYWMAWSIDENVTSHNFETSLWVIPGAGINTMTSPNGRMMTPAFRAARVT